MSCSRIFLLASLTLLAGGALVFVGALGQQAPKSAPDAKSAAAPAAPAKPDPPKADPAAVQAFDAALQQLEKNPLTWFETTLWQQMAVQGLVLQSQGIYLSGPDHRLRLDLVVHCGDTKGRMEVICDGTTFWESIQLGDKDPKVVQKVDWTKVKAALGQPDVAQFARDDFLQNMSFAGVAPLLQSLKQRLTFTKKEAAKWQGHDVVKVTGVWNPDSMKQIVPPGQPGWPSLMPRQCVAYLDAKTGWPYRLEWWGPSPPQPADQLLLQMEFRDPKLNVAMSPERVAKVFHYSPTSETVTDRTNETVQMLAEMARQGKARKKAR